MFNAILVFAVGLVCGFGCFGQFCFSFALGRYMLWVISWVSWVLSFGYLVVLCVRRCRILCDFTVTLVTVVGRGLI